MIDRTNDRRIQSLRQGLTLIELIAAIVLLSVLMTAMMGLIPRFSERLNDQGALTSVTHMQWTRVAVSRIADDLVNASRVEVSGDTLRLVGIVARNSDTGLMTDRVAECRYFLTEYGERKLLIRQQDEKRTLLGCGSVSLKLYSTDSKNKEFPTISLPSKESSPRPQLVNAVPQMRVSIVDDHDVVLASIPVFQQSTIVRSPDYSRAEP